MLIAVVAALGAALAYAVASVLQHQAASAEPVEFSMRPALLLRLVARPKWLAGVAADISGFGLQFLALSYGALVVVQPVMASGLLFALPLGTFVYHRRMTATEWKGAVEVVVGVSVFLVVASPAEGKPDASQAGWVLLLATTLGLSALFALAASRVPRRRAMLLAAATGTLYGLTAALTKTTGHLFGEGVAHAFTHWQPYALLVVGITSLLVGQSAFQAGALSSSLPVLAVFDPVASIVIGALVFDEAIGTAGIAPVIEALALASMLLGILHLARSELVAGLASDAEDPSR